MNLIELFRQSQFSKEFNSPDIKGVITVDDFSFDIRIVKNEIYCSGLSLDDFFNEGMFTPSEQLKCQNAICDWLSKLQAA